MKRFVVYVSVLLLATNVQGCVLVPFFDAFKKTGVAEGDRMELLPPQIKKFSDALGWANKTKALDVVLPESRTTIAAQIKDIGDTEKIVDSNVDDVEWLEDAYKARVTVKMKYYKVPYYIVTTRRESQFWVFSVVGGWKLRERTFIDG